MSREMLMLRTGRLDPMELRVVEALRRVHRRAGGLGHQSAKWTRAIKNDVGKIGESLGYEGYAAGCRYGHNGEWVFDLTWCRLRGQFTLQLPLIMESEWEPGGILNDFMKLVVARADRRVMVFWGRTAQDIRQKIDLMIRQVRCFSGTATGDRYLFCSWTDEPFAFNHELYIVR